VDQPPSSPANNQGRIDKRTLLYNEPPPPRPPPPQQPKSDYYYPDRDPEVDARGFPIEEDSRQRLREDNYLPPFGGNSNNFIGGPKEYARGPTMIDPRNGFDYRTGNDSGMNNGTRSGVPDEYRRLEAQDDKFGRGDNLRRNGSLGRTDSARDGPGRKYNDVQYRPVDQNEGFWRDGVKERGYPGGENPYAPISRPIRPHSELYSQPPNVSGFPGDEDIMRRPRGEQVFGEPIEYPGGSRGLNGPGIQDDYPGGLEHFLPSTEGDGYIRLPPGSYTDDMYNYRTTGQRHK